MPTETEEKVDPAVEALSLSIMTFAEMIFSGKWLKGNTDEKTAFAAKYVAFASAVSRVNTVFNGQVWDGWENGSVPTSVNGTRKPRDPDAETPGRKVKELSLTDKLLGRK